MLFQFQVSCLHKKHFKALLTQRLFQKGSYICNLIMLPTKIPSFDKILFYISFVEKSVPRSIATIDKIKF